VQSAENAIVNTASRVVNNTVNAALGSAIGAAGELLSGNTGGAIAALANAPENILASALSGLGGFAGPSSIALAGPGTLGEVSSNGGIIEGDNLFGAMNRTDPMIAYSWYCQLPIVGPGSTQTPSPTSGSILSNVGAALGDVLKSSMGGAVSTSSSAQLPWYFVEGATCPFRVYDQVTIFREGRDRKYPSKYSVDNLRLDIYSDSSNQAFKYLQAWNNTILTPFGATAAATMGGGWGRPSDYKKPIFVYLLDVTNSVVAVIEYVECWPMTVEQYTLESGASTRIVNRVTFSVGDVFINLANVSSDLISEVVFNAGQSLVNGVVNTVSQTAINSLGGALD
ncbi:hypothetical protein ACQX74_14505, partial [Staphylococcus aureus]|uniref:hypothetical protein n=1 Tax=Staphylococcus aureus TaxID=1280 RepID=UPI003D1E3753